MEKEKTFFVTQLKKLMLEKGLTQKELAEMLSVTKSNISIYLNGKQPPKPATVHKFAKALQVPPSYFIEGQKNFIENRGIIGDNNSNNFNADLKDFKIQLQDHEIRILKLENEILRKELKK